MLPQLCLSLSPIYIYIYINSYAILLLLLIGNTELVPSIFSQKERKKERKKGTSNKWGGEERRVAQKLA
jgi:hypothetical protein